MSEPAIRAIDLTKSYEGDAVLALRGVSATIHHGEMVAIVGPSGSGKSTFLNLIGTLDEPTSGRVVIDGEDVAACPRLFELRRSKIGFVFQFHNLVPNLTLLENVQVPLAGSRLRRRERARRAAELLERVGLGERLHHRANRVSGGERQRAAIARALVNRPRILLADEPTGNLDSATGRAVLDLLHEIRAEQGTTLVLVTHDPGVAAEAERTLRFRDGRVTG